MQQIILVLLNEAGFDFTFDEFRVLSNCFDEANVGIQANDLLHNEICKCESTEAAVNEKFPTNTDVIRIQSTLQYSQSVVTILAANDKFSNHGVVMDTDFIALNETSFQANIFRYFRGVDVQKRSSVRKKVAEVCVLGLLNMNWYGYITVLTC